MPLDISKLGASPSSTAGVPTPSFTLALIPAERPPVGSSVRTPAAGRAFPAVAPAPGSGVSGKGGSPGSGVGTAPGSGAGGDPRAWAGDLAKRGLPVEVTSGVLAGPDGVFARGVVARGARVDPALTGANARGEIWFGPSGQVAAPSDAMIAALDRVEKARRGDPLTPAEWRAHAAFLRAYPGGRSPANPSAPGLAPVMPDFALLALTPLPSGVPEAFFREMRSRTPFGVPYSREAAAVLGSPPLIDFARRVRPEDAAELDRLVQAGNAPPALRVYARYALANTGSMDMVRAVLERGEAGLPQDALPTRTGLPGGDDVARVAEETGLPAQEIARVRQERGVSAQDAANILKSRIFGRWTGTGGAPAGTPPLPPGTGRTGAQAPDPDDLSPEQVAQNIVNADPEVVRKWLSGLSNTEKANLPTVIIQAVGIRLAETRDLQPALPPTPNRSDVDRLLAKIEKLTPEQAGALSRTEKDAMERALAAAANQFPDLAPQIKIARTTVMLPDLDIDPNRTTGEMVSRELAALRPGQKALIITSKSNRSQYLGAFESDPRIVMVSVSQPTGSELAGFETMIRDGRLDPAALGRIIGVGAGTVQDISREVTGLVNEARGTYGPGHSGRVGLSIYNTLPSTTAPGTYYAVTHGVAEGPDGREVDPANRVFISRNPDIVRVSLPDIAGLPINLRNVSLRSAYGDVLAAISKNADELIIESLQTGRIGDLPARLNQEVPHLLRLMDQARRGDFHDWSPAAVTTVVRALNQYPADSRFGLQVGGEHRFYDAFEKLAHERGVRAPPHGTMVAIGTMLQLRAFGEMSGDMRAFDDYVAAARGAGLPTTATELDALGVSPDLMAETLRYLQAETTQYAGRPTNTLREHMIRTNGDTGLIERTFP
jgi:glycerol dehydrogenase-like iron-containing ADH family enzyme